MSLVAKGLEKVETKSKERSKTNQQIPLFYQHFLPFEKKIDPGAERPQGDRNNVQKVGRHQDYRWMLTEIHAKFCQCPAEGEENWRISNMFWVTICVRLWLPIGYSDMKLLRKYFPESYLSSFLMDLAPPKSPGKTYFFQESRMEFVILQKQLFQDKFSLVIVLWEGRILFGLCRRAYESSTCRMGDREATRRVRWLFLRQTQSGRRRRRWLFPRQPKSSREVTRGQPRCLQSREQTWWPTDVPLKIHAPLP